ncbi:hypothetical protein EMIHUDRAFT_199318 [Emiliania huxleyi CCMP1516]|uniref:NadR/Ttd14 AAA domain-containing protein n=2 Tax=Emiliania huxleyi TaxID=2903 RepID=A0A0D3KZD8_EMIH1|nr:hypothetical protein EMIHUDRAFT_199318 [Emiliania huxleyi CCMP1516]EOD41123.1 hypothetical protein EMIHUDRAFT_199318 [Emiliania huxleyi CCMP1516]|eukprot:XP_005793552.1 hypothetical protein EMIHUDRAFT_199318 [Emiliania huxleyi CCMP1516]
MSDAVKLVAAAAAGGAATLLLHQSSSLEHLTKALTANGFDVLCVPEVTSARGAVEPMRRLPIRALVEFETGLIQAQLQLENSFTQIARSTGRPTVVILDRGLLDVGAYLPPKVWTDVILKENGMTEASIAARRAIFQHLTRWATRYDLVLHLVTAADGAEKFYTTENNAARTETAEQARELDLKIRSCYKAHPKLEVIGNTGSFDAKLQSATKLVLQMVGS